MKVSPLITTLSIATLGHACVTAHSYFSSCVFDIADGINHVVVQLWDNGVEVCQVGASDPGGSQDTAYEMDCDNGAHITAYGYGDKIDYTSADGYFVSLQASDYSGVQASNCGTVADHTVHGSFAESAFADEYCESCNTATLCDGRSYCDFDPTCNF